MATNRSELTNRSAVSASLDPGGFDPVAENSLTLPASWYFDPEIYRLEHEAIFYRNWWYQCHVGDVAEPGDYYAGSVADQAVFIIRDQAGELHAFYNVCSHRAHPLLEGQGNTSLIVCPYHQWCYRADGCFHGARGRESLRDWIPDNADLKPVRLENYGGLLFVNLDPQAVPLARQSPKFLRDMYATCPGLDRLVRAYRFEREIAANWKTLIDNNHECYHCKVNHKSLMELVDYESRAAWSNDEITFSHAVERKNADNSAYAVDPSQLEQDSLFGYIWPNSIPLFFPGTPSLILFQVVPLAPEKSLLRHDFYLLNREPSKQETKFIDWFCEVLNQEDVSLCENVQRGLHSRGYSQGKFVVDRDHVEFSEHHVHFFQDLVLGALRGARNDTISD